MNQLVFLLSLYSVTSGFAFESGQKILEDIQDNTHDIFSPGQKVFFDTSSDGEYVEVFWSDEKSTPGPKVEDAPHKISNTTTMLNVRNTSSISIGLTHWLLVR